MGQIWIHPCYSLHVNLEPASCRLAGDKPTRNFYLYRLIPFCVCRSSLRSFFTSRLSLNLCMTSSRFPAMTPIKNGAITIPQRGNVYAMSPYQVSFTAWLLCMAKYIRIKRTATMQQVLRKIFMTPQYAAHMLFTSSFLFRLL